MRTVALGEIVSDARPGFASGEDTADGIVQVRMNNVTTEGTFDWSKLRRVPEPKKLNDLIVETNDILLNATNSPDLVGKNAVFRGFSEPVTFSNHFIRIRLDERVADSGLVSRWLDKLKLQHRAQLAKLDALFGSLQHRAFRGEL